MSNKIYTPLGVKLTLIESKALAHQVEQELLLADPTEPISIIADMEINVNENSGRNDRNGSDANYSKNSKSSKK